MRNIHRDISLLRRSLSHRVNSISPQASASASASTSSTSPKPDASIVIDADAVSGNDADELVHASASSSGNLDAVAAAEAPEAQQAESDQAVDWLQELFAQDEAGKLLDAHDMNSSAVAGISLSTSLSCAAAPLPSDKLHADDVATAAGKFYAQLLRTQPLELPPLFPEFRLEDFVASNQDSDSLLSSISSDSSSAQAVSSNAKKRKAAHLDQQQQVSFRFVDAYRRAADSVGLTMLELAMMMPSMTDQQVRDLVVGVDMPVQTAATIPTI